MRKLLVATTAVALLGAAGSARAETLDLALGDMETITAGMYGGFLFDYAKYGHVDVWKNFDIRAHVDVDPHIKGNFADGEAAATAYGPNTYTETLSFADVYEGLMSRSGSSSIAATKGNYYHHDRYKGGYK